MTNGPRPDVTILLKAVEAGDESARSRLWDVIYEELRAIAIHQMKDEPSGRTLQPTALVHEAWLRLVGPEGGWNSRSHFFGAVARVMREILVDDARKRGRIKRGGDRRRLDGSLVDLQSPVTQREPDEVLAVNEAVDKLRRMNDRQADVIVCRYFAGMSNSQTAQALGVSLRTVQADSAVAAAWLRRELADTDRPM